MLLCQTITFHSLRFVESYVRENGSSADKSYVLIKDVLKKCDVNIKIWKGGALGGGEEFLRQIGSEKAKRLRNSASQTTHFSYSNLI